MKRVLAPLVALAAVLAAPAVPASAEPAGAAPGLVTFHVEGHVRTLQNITALTLGDPFVLEYTVDPATPSSGTTDVFATYPAVKAMDLTVAGKYRLQATSGTVSIADNSSVNSGVGDEYRAQFTGLTESPPIGPVLPNGPLAPVNGSPVYAGGRLPPSEVFLQLDDYAEGGPADAINGLGLPATPPDLALFGAGEPYFAVSFKDPGCRLGGSICPRALMEATVESITAVTPVVDADRDGVADTIGGTAAGAFDDRSGTTGQILSGAAGTLVTDAPAPQGVRITTTAASSLRLCPAGFTIDLSAGSDVVLTCGSVTATVTSGTTTIGIGPGGHVAVPPGGNVTVDRLPTGDYKIVNNGTTPVPVTRAGTVSTLAGGATTYSAPQQRSDCLNGGWAQYGVFSNQGQCVASVSRG